MGRRKKTDPPVEPPKAKPVSVTLFQGPRGGEQIRLCNPPPETLVLAEPEWMVYERIGPAQFKYVGEGKYGHLNEKMRARLKEWDLGGPLV